MSPVVNLSFCPPLYEKYISIKNHLDDSLFREEPEGVVRFSQSDSEAILDFWRVLGFRYPLLCYIISDMPQYEKMLSVMRDELSGDELGQIAVYDAETCMRVSLSKDQQQDSVLLAIHAMPVPSLERKILSVFSDSSDNDDDRDSRLLSREGTDDRRDSRRDAEDRLCYSIPFLDDFENDCLMQVEEAERQRREKERRQRSGNTNHRKQSKKITDRGR